MKVILDIDTPRMTPAFLNSWDREPLIHLAPNIDLIGILDIEQKQNYIFQETDLDEAIKILNNADEIITYNGKRFDYLVISKALNLKETISFKATHTDLQECIYDEGYGRMKLEDALHYFTKKIPKEIRSPQDQMLQGLNTTYKLWLHYIENKNNL